MIGQHGKPVPIRGWTLRYKDVAPKQEGLREALCTLGNGYFATRGAAPESQADGTHYPGTYIAGCFNQLRTEVAGRAVEYESAVNAPNWLPLTFAVGDGAWLGLGHADVLSDRQDLDLRRGVLTRRLRVRDDLGHRTLVIQRRFVHMGAAHLGALEMTIVPENWSGRLHVRSEIDGTVTNSGVPRYRELASRHLIHGHARTLPPDGMLLVMETSQSHILIAEAVRTRVFHNGARMRTDATVSQQPGRIGQQFQIGMATGDRVVIEKTVAITTSRDRAVSEVGIAAAGWLETAGSFGELLAQHTTAWAHLWERFQIRLHNGEDDAVLPVLRLHAFHLLQTVGPNTVGLDAGVPARGLHGEAYRGHVFWDELFVFPVLNLRLPQLSRSLLAYRYYRLPEARRAAIEAGHAGAMFPWQSGSDGSEQSALLHLNPQSGRWLPDTTYLQRHVGIAIAYNVWQYYQATGDLPFLADQGAEILLEIARFFASMAAFDRELGRYVIRGVVGPDEFHTSYPDSARAGIDNNAYTNVMTSWLLLHAIEVLDVLPAHRREELTDRLRITAAERQRWEHISRRIYVPFHSDGIISQFEGYENLKELDWEDYRARYGNIRRLDRILEAEGDSPDKYKVSKQADVLMLLYLLSADELTALLRRLGYDWSPCQISDTIDYYLARTSDGSTLSTVVHAWVLARAHRERTLEEFIEALRSDVADVQGGTTAEGIHLAAMAGTIDVLQRCFAGIETRDDVLWLNPFCPQSLGILKLPILYRGHVITLTVLDHTVLVHSGPGNLPPVSVGCGGQVHELSPGQTREFWLGQAAEGPAVAPVA
jgi:trehalose/maltose hydrolase-like predicted phosphorylase